MTQATTVQTIQSLVQEDTQLAVTVANLREQLEDTQARRKVVRAALEGIRLGQALEKEIAAEAAAEGVEA